MLLITARMIQSDQVDFTAANNNNAWKHKGFSVCRFSDNLGMQHFIITFSNKG